jgi:hypothetical protein
MMQRPSTRDYRSIRAWFANHQPLVDKESDYLKIREDMVMLGPEREPRRLDEYVELVVYLLDKVMMRLGCTIIRVSASIRRMGSLFLRANSQKRAFVPPEMREKTADRHLIYYRLDWLISTIIGAIMCVLLILPIVAMYELSSLNQRASLFEAIAILIVSTILFGTAMSTLTKTSRRDLFAASAAYCGVLVVFISNFSVQQVTIAS